MLVLWTVSWKTNSNGKNTLYPEVKLDPKAQAVAVTALLSATITI